MTLNFLLNIYQDDSSYNVSATGDLMVKGVLFAWYTSSVEEA